MSSCADVDLSWDMCRGPAGEVYLALRGDIDGDASLAPIFGGSRRVVIDFGDVRRIDLGGAFRLGAFLRLLGDRADAHRCPPAFVGVLDRMPILARMLRVRSLMVPFRCPRCGADGNQAVDVDMPAPLPAASCPACAQTIELALPPPCLTYMAAPW